MVEVAAGGALDRRAVVSRLLEGRNGLLVVSGLGSASYDVMAAGDHDENYYLWAAMGSAAMVGLGLAASAPERSVLVLTGDGEMLMGLGSLATIALRKPSNLTIGVLDNGHFGETGMQLSHAGRGIRIEQVAASCGFSWAKEIRHMSELADLRERIVNPQGTSLATIKINPENVERVLPPKDGVYVKNRFRAALGYRPI